MNQVFCVRFFGSSLYDLHGASKKITNIIWFNVMCRLQDVITLSELSNVRLPHHLSEVKVSGSGESKAGQQIVYESSQTPLIFNTKVKGYS